MESFHTPVLVDEVCRALSPSLAAVGQPPSGILVDVTCGSSGHTSALLEATRPEAVILLDRDPAALAHAAQRLRRAPCAIELVHAPFSRIADILQERGIDHVSAILADLGVSSHQLDSATRGFSWRTDAPLDMRMDPDSGISAAEFLRSTDASALARILEQYGEEPDAVRIAAAIIDRKPQTTGALAEVVESTMTARQRRRLGRRIHPATRVFQALRIHVNHELHELDRLLQLGPDLLVVGGRLAIITFHSLEDRRVKRRFRELSRVSQPPAGVPVLARDLPDLRYRIPSEFRGGIRPSEAECRQNPRARSARLRVVQRCAP